MRFRRTQYVLLALLFAIMLNGCSTVNADVHPAEATPAILPSPSALPEQTAVAIPEFSEDCEVCALPEIEPLPEGYTLENDIASSGDSEENPADMSEYQKITAEQAKSMMDADKSVLVIDVRTQEEYAQGHISGALLIPNETITDQPPEQLGDKDAVILIYCRSGNRSEQAALKLLDMGYTQVYDFGGIIDWPYETVTGLDA